MNTVTPLRVVLGLLLAAVCLPINACTSAKAEVRPPSAPSVLKIEAAPGDSIAYGLAVGTVATATSYRWTVVATRALGPLPTNQVTTLPAVSFIVAKPGTPTTVDSVTFGASVVACNAAGCSAPSATTSWKYVRKVVPPSPGPITVDSSGALGIIGVPESTSYAQVAKRTLTLTPATCITEPAGTTYPCQQDLAQMGCAYYRDGGNYSNSAPAIPHAKMVTWPDQFGVQQPLGGVAYNRDGTPHAQCAGVLPVLCVVADMADGWRLLTKESFQRSPACRKQLFNAPLHTVGGFWLFADTSRVVETPVTKFEQMAAERGNHPNEPWGLGNPGDVGYALLNATMPYPVGLFQSAEPLAVPLGATVELAIYLRMSDGSVQKQVDPHTLYRADVPGRQTVTATTDFGKATLTFDVLSPVRVAQRLP